MKAPKVDVNEILDAFRRGVLDIDCKRMVLSQRKEGGERFEGPGYIRQASDGTLTLKIYADKIGADRVAHFNSLLSNSAGKVYADEMFYDLEAVAHDGLCWNSSRIRPGKSWDHSGQSVLIQGEMQSITAPLDWPQTRHHLTLHFFEEYRVPLNQMSEVEKHGGSYFMRDRAEFKALGSEFIVRVREGSGDTVIEIASDTSFPVAFDLRVQEALQYITAKTAFWRARFQSVDNGMELELSSPSRRSAHTQFSPPITPGSANFIDHGWSLFEKYLAYVVSTTNGTYWNPVAYHLYNACEATSASVDAWAAGVSVAIEAVASLINIDNDLDNEAKLVLFQQRALEWFAEQSDLQTVAPRVIGQIRAMKGRSPKDVLRTLATTGHVEKSYIGAWGNLRNRHIHPTLKDRKKPNAVDNQKLLDGIHKSETLLRQLTFRLIGYHGPFTDYGTHTFPTKQYPLPVAI